VPFDQARDHHVGPAKESAEGAHGVGDAASALDNFLIGALGVGVPLPGVFAKAMISRLVKQTIEIV